MLGVVGSHVAHSAEHTPLVPVEHLIGLYEYELQAN